MKCLNPMVLERKNLDSIVVPCGMCRWCRMIRANMWAMRMMHEREFWKDAVFVTLTYNNENLPVDGSVSKREAQLFMKRLRKNSGKRLRYFMCGEYGGKYGRPHYHCIVFGLGYDDADVILSSWGLGFIKVGGVTKKSCRYVAKYLQKAALGRMRGLEEPRAREFNLCSKGLGLPWLEANAAAVGERGLFVRGKQASMPRYYVKKLRERGLLSDNVIEDAKSATMSWWADFHKLGGDYRAYQERRIDEVKTLDGLHGSRDADDQ